MNRSTHPDSPSLVANGDAADGTDPFDFGPVWRGADAFGRTLEERKSLSRFRSEVRQWLQTDMPADWSYGRAARDLHDFDSYVHARMELERLLGSRGLIGLSWPDEEGGAGRSPLFDIVVEEELAFARGPLTPFANGRTLVGPTLLAYGTPEQKARYLPGIVTGSEYWCQGFSEPSAGSDLAGLRCRGEVGEDSILVTGQKTWTTLAQYSTHMFLLVRTTDGGPVHAGMSMLLVDLPAEGLEVKPIRQANGDHEFCEVFFDAVSVPLCNVVGGIGNGWSVAMSTFGLERSSHFMAVHIRIRTEIEELARLCASRESLQVLDAQDQLDDLRTESDALAALIYRTVRQLAQGQPPGSESSLLKIAWTELHQRVLDVALAVAMELTADDPEDADARFWFRQRVTGLAETVFAGTNEIQRDVVAERVLDLPKSGRR